MNSLNSSNKNCVNCPCPCKNQKSLIEEELECTICLDFAVSPIQSCSNGHIVCRLCFDKVKTCGCCKEILRPCGFADRLAAKHHDVEMPCNNSASGCKSTFKSTAIYDHLLNCEFRAMACFERQRVDCQGKLYELQEFYEHLKSIHNCEILKPSSRGTFHKRYSEVSFIKKCQNVDVDGIRWPTSCFKFDDKMFMIHAAGKDSGIFWYFTTTGDHRSYVCKTTIVSPNPWRANQEKYSWILPVLPFHGTENGNVDVESTGSYARIHPQTLKPMCTKGMRGRFGTTRIQYGDYFMIKIEMKRV